jgi:SHS2 domain-containing protein
MRPKFDSWRDHMTYEFVEHTGDIKIKVIAKTLEQAFTETARALKESITELKIKPKTTKQITLSGTDTKNLLYKFLEEFLYLLDSEDFIFSEIKDLKIKNNTLTATVLGDKTENYKISNEVKAITYNEMEIGNSKKETKIQVVLDV